MSGDSLEGLPLSLAQQVLLNTDGTVTDLVALYSGETIHITKLGQKVIQSCGPTELQLAKPTALLQRNVLLSGRHRHYLYAESYFVIKGMAADLQRQLLETETPIGLLWKQARVEMFREVVQRQLEQRPELLDYFDQAQDARFLSRSYLVIHQGQPLGLITEKFPYSYFRD